MWRFEKGAAEPAARPFLKWAGGKAKLMPQLRPLLPKRYGRYHEPFLGGGAMYFELAPLRARLADRNQELIVTWSAVQDDPELLIKYLSEFRYDREEYYRVRAIDPADLTYAQAAARMIYLNKCGFNGLYRVNSKGKFNVPFGRYDDPVICDAENIRACHQQLLRPAAGGARDVQLFTAPFEKVLGIAERGDFVYFDPPYVPTSDTARFTAYGSEGFGEADQRRLADVFRELSDDGVLCMLSNSDTPLVRELYADYPIREVTRSGNISSNAKGRGRVTEVVVRSDVW
jgi:DNA adenine methylase